MSFYCHFDRCSLDSGVRHLEKKELPNVIPIGAKWNRGIFKQGNLSKDPSAIARDDKVSIDGH